YGTSIAIDTEIENLINSSSNDLIIANPVANIFSGYAPGLTTGDDVFIGTDNLDTLDLSKFSFLDISKVAHETDLKVELGLGNSITVPNYLGTSKDKRINVLLSDQGVSIKEADPVVEGDDGVKLVNFTVELDQTSSERIAIDYTTVDRTAKEGSDYIAKAGTVVFEPGETSKNIAVEIKGDTEIEGSEEFELHLLGNYGQIVSRGYGLIDDNDGSESLSTITISDAIVTSGNDGTKAIFEVRVDEFIDFDPITVDFATQDNVANAGQDYVATSGTLSFSIQDRDKVQTIEVDLIDDNILSRDEDFTLQLSNPSSNATIADHEGVGTILDSTLKIELPDNTETKLQLASYPPDLVKDPNNLPFEVDAVHNALTITGDGNGWKEIPLGEYIGTGQKPLNPYSVVEFDFKTTEPGKLHGIHFEGKDHHAFYAPWERGRFFQLAGSGEFGIQDFNNYDQGSGEWQTYQIPVHEYFDTTNYRRFGEWIVFAHEGNSDDSNSQFRNLQIKELLPISVESVTVGEGSDLATFTLTIPEASDTPISLDYATADDTAIAGKDYTAKKGTVIFAPGDTSKTISVAINDDTKSETTESFSLNLSNVSDAIALESAITATIEDNDEPLPIISIEDVSFAEGNSGQNNVSVAIAIDKPSTKQITVAYTTEDDTARVDEDYQEATGTVIFALGETNKTIDLVLTGDVLNEADESLLLNLSDAVNADLNREHAVITIKNDDALPQISVQDASVLSSIPIKNGEGNIKNSTGLLFEVSLDSPSNQTVKVDYATVDGTAKASQDYSAKNKTLTFQPGETVKNVFIGVTLDDTVEDDEQLYLDLSNAENATINRDRAVGTVEETRSLSVSNTEISESGTEAIFTVSLDKPSVQGVFVSYATEDGTATAGADYQTTKGRLFIKAGAASGTVSVPIIDNQITETDETFYLNLTKPKYVLLESDRAEATIINDDSISSFNPGGIYQNLQLWVKPDAAVANDEQKVTKWYDNSQQGLDLAQTTADSQPTLAANALNHNSVLRFDGDDLLATVNTLPADFVSNSSVFVVTKSASNRNNFLFTLNDTGSGRFLAHMPWSNRIYFDAGNTSTGRISIPYPESNANQFNTWHFSSDQDSGQSIFRNGLSVANDQNTSTPKTSDRYFQIGRQFQGDIAEVIVFNEALEQSDRQKVDSYLATKYGFTLDQTTPTDYLNSDGEVIWSASEAGNYSHDLAGVTIDSGSGLFQQRSRSSSDDSVVTIDNASDLQDGEALFWSNNNASLDPGAITLTNELTNNRYHLNRQWRVQSTDNVGKVDLSFDLIGLGYTSNNPQQFALLIDEDGDFNNAKIHQTELKLDGNEVSFKNVDLKDGAYFTLAVPEPQAPGGIKTNLQLWLRGDSTIVEAGEVVQWRDRSGKNRNYTPQNSDNQPKLAANKINFNPVVYFDGDDPLITARENFAQGEVFFLLQGEDNGMSSSLFNDRSGYDTSSLRFEQWHNTKKLGFTRRNIKDYTSDIKSPNHELSLISFSSEAENNLVDITVETNGSSLKDSLDIEASRPLPLEYLAQGFKGKIAEVVVFDSVLSDAERLKLRSNLAIKYGLTLDRGTNYLNSDNEVWWDADLAEKYTYDVAAIVQDDSADLRQEKSRSSNAEAIITIAAEDTFNGLEDGEALVWGNNNSENIGDRIWQVQEHQGDVGNLTVSFDLSKLGQQVPIANYALEISSSDDFNNSQLITTGRKIEADTLTFTDINFQHGSYFTLNSEYVEEESVMEFPVELTIAEEEPVIETSVIAQDPVIKTPVVEEESVIETPVVEKDTVIETSVITEEPVINVPVVIEPSVVEKSVIESPVVEELPVIETPVIAQESITESTIVVKSPIVEEPVIETPVMPEPSVVEEEPLIETSVAATSAVIGTFEISPLELTEVHRFYNPEAGYHLYSMNESDRQELSNDNQTKYNYEGESFTVLDNLDELTGEMAQAAQPVYGFLNQDTNAQLFTMDVTEQNYIIDSLDNYQSLGVAYYALATELEDIATIPVYRLLNEDTGTHLLTSDRHELDYIQDNFDHFNLENNSEPVFYALEV
ncbi:MAG: Calx-beta domain-containing protein, partial [Cyanobacteria bacterium J06600_6]